MKKRKKLTLVAFAVAVVLSFSAGDRFRNYKWDQWMNTTLANIDAEAAMKSKAQLRCL